MPSDFDRALEQTVISLLQSGPLKVKEYGTHWNGVNAPAAATQATKTQAAAGAGIKNVCTGITVSLSCTTAPAAAAAVTFVLRDGTTGAGTIIWETTLSLQAVAGQCVPFATGSIWIEGSANTAMTLESVGAPAANISATVAIHGSTTT